MLDSELVRIFCTYSTDGNSMARTCDHGGPGDGQTCIPGCAPLERQCFTPECNCWDCSFPPTHTREALQAQLKAGVVRHNEVIIDTRSISENLPGVVLGFFYLAGNDASDARETREDFVTAYGLDADAAPLIRVDWSADQDVFTLQS